MVPSGVLLPETVFRRTELQHVRSRVARHLFRHQALPVFPRGSTVHSVDRPQAVVLLPGHVLFTALPVTLQFQL